MSPRNRAGRLRRAALRLGVLGVVLLLLGVASRPLPPSMDVAGRAIGVATNAVPAAATVNFSVNVTASEFTPANLSAVAGTTAAIAVSNVDAYDHTYTVVNAANLTIPTNYTPAQLNAFVAGHGTLANVSLAPGASGWANVSLPAASAGTVYPIVSLVAFQFQAGYRGTLTSTVAGTRATYALATNTTTSLKFSPSLLDVPSVAAYPITVSVTIVNQGSSGHTFWIAGADNYTIPTSNYSAYFGTHPPLAAVTIPSSSGGSVVANFTITKSGSFEFICNVPSHYAAGMFGWLYVGWAPAPPPPPPSSALVNVAFLAGGGALLGIALLLTLVAQFTGRFPRSPDEPHSH